MLRLWTINFDENPFRFLIILIFGFRHVFDVVFDMDELSQNENSRFSLCVEQKSTFSCFSGRGNNAKY